MCSSQTRLLVCGLSPTTEGHHSSWKVPNSLPELFSGPYSRVKKTGVLLPVTEEQVECVTVSYVMLAQRFSTGLPRSGSFCKACRTCAHFLLRLFMCTAAMCWKSCSAGMSSGSRVRNWAMWMKSMEVRTSW